MSQEESISVKAKVYTTMEQAIEKIEEHKLHDICRVIGNNFQFYILVDDLDGNKFWHPFDGVHYQEALNANSAFKAGQQKYREKPLTAEDVEHMRNIMTAVATLSVLFEYTEEMIVQLTDNAIVKFAFDLYRRDVKKPDLKLSDLQPDDPEMGAYVSKVTFAFEEYKSLLEKVQSSVDEATTEAAKVPEEENHADNT